MPIWNLYTYKGYFLWNYMHQKSVWRDLGFSKENDIQWKIIKEVVCKDGLRQWIPALDLHLRRLSEAIIVMKI